jgi:hypothetical protein
MPNVIKQRSIHLLRALYGVCVGSFFLTTVAVADDVPNFDVTKSCHAGQSIATTVDPFEACMKKEREARDQLKAQWNQFRQEDKARCVELCNCGNVAGSYIELLTCLEMSPASGKFLPKTPESSPDNK